MLYVASRTHHAQMWREARWRFEINSTWIDEAGEGQTADFAELWQRIQLEVEEADSVVLYVTPDDFPLKGAFIECGMALAMGKPIHVAAVGVELEQRSMRPIGSWLHHPLVTVHGDLESAMCAAATAPIPDQIAVNE